jgi:hypothetical protein
MLTKKEIIELTDNSLIKKEIATLQKDFSQIDRRFAEIEDEDFAAFVLITPSVGIALANREITFFEEMMLNKKARQLSQDAYFIKRDPVVHALQSLVVHFEEWENRFLEVIRLMIENLLEKNQLSKEVMSMQRHLDKESLLALTPPLFTKLLAFLFLDREESFFIPRKVSAFDYKKILEISKKLRINEFTIFQRFYETFSLL